MNDSSGRNDATAYPRYRLEAVGFIAHTSTPITSVGDFRSLPTINVDVLTAGGVSAQHGSSADGEVARRRGAAVASRRTGRTGRGSATRGRGRGPRARRGSSARRARGGGSGQRRVSSRVSDPSEGSTLISGESSSVLMEEKFANKVIVERARLFCLSAVINLNTQFTVWSLSPTRAGFVVLLMKDLIRQCVDWLNELVHLNGSAELSVTKADVYRYVSVLLLSHCSGFSFEKTLSILKNAGSTVPSLERLRFISSNILGYSPTGRGSEGAGLWNSQRDRTQQLSEFEDTAFRETKKVFFSPLHLMATLDDYLFGTRAAANQVKMLSSRKADKEGHSADAVADALFRITLAIRFRRRGEGQAASVAKLIGKLVEGRGEQALNGCIVTADREYGKEAFLNLLIEHGLASVFVMPEHLARCHLFVGRSFLDAFRDDRVEEDQEVGTAGAPPNGLEQHGNGENLAEQTTNENDTAGLSTDIATAPAPASSGTGSATASSYDRRPPFVIDDAPDLGPECFLATKRAASNGSRVGVRKTTAVAVREHGTEKCSKVLRFLYTVPDAIHQMLNTWVAVPKG